MHFGNSGFASSGAMEHITPAKESEIRRNIFKSEVQRHITNCGNCKGASLSVDNFKVMKQCRDDYSAKVNEAKFN